MKFYIEWEIPMLRGIYYDEYNADNEEEARNLFALAHPRGRIRIIESYHK